MKNLGDLIDLTKDLDKVAIVYENTSYTYKQLDILINGISAGLVARGIQQGDRVAIVSTNSVNFIATYLGILKIGAVAVLVNCKLPDSQLEYILNDSESKLVFTNMQLSTTLSVVHFDDIDKFVSSDTVTTVILNENDPAFILYTSGSTSFPKGVIVPHTHRWLIDLKIVTNELAPFRRSLVAAPGYHMNGLYNIELSIAGHGTLILLSQFDAKTSLEVIQKYKVNVITGVPPMLAMMLEDKELVSQTDLSSIVVITLSSAPISQNLYDKMKQAFPGVKIYIAYGITEVGPGIFGQHPDSLARPDLSVGYPVDGIDYRLVDGILQIRSPAMMIKYTNTDSSAITNDGYFITNDTFRVDQDGFYYFVGRADDMFVSGGNNIYPRQIEEIIETHGSVISSAVFAVEDEVKGTKPYAFVVLDSKRVDETALKTYLSTQLAYSHIPRRIWIVAQMPMLGTNKINKAELKERAISLIKGI